MNGRVISSDELSKARPFGDFCPVFKIDDNTVVKTGDCVRLAEAAAMKLVRERTTIPVPEIFNAYTDEDSGHVRIVMQFVEGDVLADVWEKFNNDQKADVIEQLRGFFSQLRNIKGSFIGSVDGTACEDQMFTDELGAYGPYEDEAAFNDGIVTALKRSKQNAWVDLVSNMIEGILKGHDTVMTHGDFCPRNIIVQGTRVAAVIDWEMSGFYPEYWEYVKALYRPAWESGWIKERAVDYILHPYLSELGVILHTRDIVW
ncbi:phosphotransferase enzyme family protein-like protein [Xylona heveae TC161]|uniref:Phosphotransferase enzyme family protein-like protein n=1 Tax=Xylona heveae (strain CBS 132557 / TC161) TaxID=1328760 RepID=A0A165FHR1_XYLHT|nr:phosphotransferase enzyme family protein-like protein [Xylona heveae TC161]KZF20993.1 phosphotransferase enzyme family protein-like protein [Xylona heveae TC161]